MEPKILKLWRVTLRGMQTSRYGVTYVVAEDPTSAYLRVKTFLDGEKIGYSKDRELDKIELMADEYLYTDTPSMLFV